MKGFSLRHLSLLSILFFLQACYSFSGINISPDIQTYYVEQLRNNASNSPPILAQEFTEALKDKVRFESRLIFSEINPDVEFKGSIVSYRVTSEAPTPGETTAINRLTIVLAIEYIHNKEKDAGWKKNFSHQFDFDSSTDLFTIQDEAIEVIREQILENIFNEAFTDW